MTMTANNILDDLVDEMRSDNRRSLYAALLAVAAADVIGLPLPVRTETTDTEVVFVVRTLDDLNRWAEWVEEDVVQKPLIHGRKVAGIDTELHQVPFRLVCTQAVA